MTQVHRVKLQRDAQSLTRLADDVLPWALANGLVLSGGGVCPVALLPTPVPRKEFQKAKDLGLLFNTLVHTLSNNHEFITSSLRQCVAFFLS